MPDRLILFDIDCTLIDARGAGGRAILRAIKDVYGVEGELGDYSFHGRTDPGIIGDLASLWGACEPDAAAGADGLVDVCIARYVELLREEIARVEVETLPGIRELVTALVADRRALVGLLTGNVEEGARLKLEPTGLLPLFRVGAYGSDSGLRADLPAVAVARAEALDGRRYAGKDVVVIGDARPTSSAARRSGSRRSASPPAGTPWTSWPVRTGPPLRRLHGLARGLRRHHGLKRARPAVSRSAAPRAAPGRSPVWRRSPAARRVAPSPGRVRDRACSGRSPE